MNAVDILIVVVASIAVAVGMRFGLLRQIGLSLGMLVGCFVAALAQSLLAPRVVNSVGSDGGSVAFWFMLLAAFLLVGLVTDFGWSFGMWLHKHWHVFRRSSELWLSKSTGALLAGLVTLVSLWLLSVMFLRSPSPLISGQVLHSGILNSLNRKLPAAPNIFAKASNLLDPHATPFAYFDHEPRVGAETPNSQMASTDWQKIKNIQQSAVHIVGRGCGGTVSGSGFVVADNLVMTNAHVIAGLSGTQISITDIEGQHQAVPIFFDPLLDIAVLRSAGLAGGPMPIEVSPNSQTGPGASFGYSSGSLLINPVTITGKQSATGYDIYNRDLVIRDIYAFRGRIEKGDSGGPLVNQAGRVVGVVFAKSSNYTHVGYALSANEIAKDLISALANKDMANTGSCGSY